MRNFSASVNALRFFFFIALMLRWGDAKDPKMGDILSIAKKARAAGEIYAHASHASEQSASDNVLLVPEVIAIFVAICYLPML